LDDLYQFLCGLIHELALYGISGLRLIKIWFEKKSRKDVAMTASLLLINSNISWNQFLHINFILGVFLI
jgi:hypothetical protein